MAIARTEVVIVGSGPVGAAAAQALTDAGVDVTLLEAGTRPEKNRFRVMQKALLGKIPWRFPHYNYEMNGDDIQLNEFAIRKLGGSSLAWGAITPRYHPNDFRMASAHGLALDWPISYDELEPQFCAAERFMGVSGAADNPWTPPRSEPYPMANFPMNDSDLLVKDVGDKLGIQFHSVPVARNSTPYQGRSACLYYTTCRACPIGAMYSSHQTVERLELSPHFNLLLETNVVRIETGKDGSAHRVIYLDGNGQEQAIEGSKVVLAAQSVENVRILLNSENGTFPNGLANKNGMLGHYFMEHLKFYMMGRVKERLTPYRQGFETATTFKYHDHERRSEYSGGRLLVRENAGPPPALIANVSGHWGRELREEVAEIFGHYVTLGAFLEQLPYEHNIIKLSDKVRTIDGTRAARVDFELVGEYERRGYEEMQKVMREIFAGLNATDVRVVMPPSNSGHYMGGHRMGNDPATSTTDSYMETHEVKGLYLAGGGALPTSGISNPTLTSVALTFRMTDRILAER